ncbi:hypothetical protein EON63_14480 [archaeon]|nr:MAG: hypothetical protein EON63_14480 [archaeon]
MDAYTHSHTHLTHIQPYPYPHNPSIQHTGSVECLEMITSTTGPKLAHRLRMVSSVISIDT